MSVMNKELQIDKIKKELRNFNVDPDTVDIEAELDPTLSYPENRDAILGMHASLSEEQMAGESVGQGLTGEIENLKKSQLSKEQVERMVQNAMSKKERVIQQVVPRAKSVQLPAAVPPTLMNIPTRHQPAPAPPGRFRFRNLRGAGYRATKAGAEKVKAAVEKVPGVKYLEETRKQKKERETKMKEIAAGVMQNQIEEDRKNKERYMKRLESGIAEGYAQAGVTRGRQMARSQLVEPAPKKSRLNKLIEIFYSVPNAPEYRAQKQALSAAIQKEKQSLLAQEQVAQATRGLRARVAQQQVYRDAAVEQARQQAVRNVQQVQQMQNSPARILQLKTTPAAMNPLGPSPLFTGHPEQFRRVPPAAMRQVQPGTVQPHRENANPLTGVCRTCGRKHMRFL
jgi:hypothetical protein